MTIDQIEMVEAVVELGSFQAAAKKLNKSQPSISVGIRKIEELYNIQLFSREEYRPRLTSDGELFLRYAEKALESYRTLDTLARELGIKQESQLRLYVDHLIGFKKLDFIFDEVKKSSTPLPVSIHGGILGDNIKALKKGLCEFAIGTLPQKIDRDLDVVPFCEVLLTPVIHKKLIGKSRVSNKTLQTIPNIVVQSQDPDESPGSGLSPNHWKVEDHQQKVELIREGRGWGRLELSETQKNKNLIPIPEKVCPPVSVKMHFCRNKRQPLGPVAQSIWNKVHSTP